MKPLSPLENAMYAVGSLNITAICILEKPCDLVTILREVQYISDRSHRLSNTVRRHLFWHFWEESDRPVRFDDHVTVIEAAGCTEEADLAEIAAKIRLLPLPDDRPRWKIFLVNPRMPGSAGVQAAGSPLSALIVHFDHVISDPVRLFKLFQSASRSVAGNNASDEELEVFKLIARSLPRLDTEQLLSLAEDRNIIHTESAFFDIGKSELANEGRSPGGKTDLVLRIAAAALGNSLHPRKGKLECHFTKSIFSNSIDTGNHFETFYCDAVLKSGVGGTPEGWTLTNWRKAGHLAAKLTSLLPPSVLRALLHRFYSPDISIALVPITPKITIGGSEVVKVFGFLPAPGRLPIMLGIVSGNGRLHFSVSSGCQDPTYARAVVSAFGKQLDRYRP